MRLSLLTKGIVFLLSMSMWDLLKYLFRPFSGGVLPLNCVAWCIKEHVHEHCTVVLSLWHTSKHFLKCTLSQCLSTAYLIRTGTVLKYNPHMNCNQKNTFIGGERYSFPFLSFIYSESLIYYTLWAIFGKNKKKMLLVYLFIHISVNKPFQWIPWVLLSS